MDDTIPVGGGTDLPWLWLVTKETAVGSGSVGLRGQFFVQRTQFVFEVEVKRGHGWSEPFAFSGLVSGTQQRIERDDLSLKVAMAFRALPPLLLRQPPTNLPISSTAMAAKP
jgi:hypothetical protein